MTMTPEEKGRRKGLRQARAIVKAVTTKTKGEMAVVEAILAILDIGLKPRNRGIHVRRRR